MSCGMGLQNPRTSEELHDRRMRASALLEVSRHSSQAQIAHLLGVSRQAVHQWHHPWFKGAHSSPGPLG